MSLSSKDIFFSVGDLIVDRQSKEMGLLIKKIRVLRTELMPNHKDNISQSVSKWGWEILWIKRTEKPKNIGFFKNLDHILTEEGMQLSILSGIIEHFPVGLDYGIDINTYLQG